MAPFLTWLIFACTQMQRSLNHLTLSILNMKLFGGVLLQQYLCVLLPPVSCTQWSHRIDTPVGEWIVATKHQLTVKVPWTKQRFFKFFSLNFNYYYFINKEFFLQSKTISCIPFLTLFIDTCKLFFVKYIKECLPFR